MQQSENKGSEGRQRVTRNLSPVLSIVLTTLLVIGMSIAVASVDVFPVVTNDSVLYLEHSRNLVDTGWVQYGYRQFGYPLFLATTRALADVIGTEPLLTTVIVQRVLLLVAAFLIWRLWKWWSLPVLALVASPHVLAYTNLLLTEALGLPLALLLVYPTVRYLRLLDPDEAIGKGRGGGWFAVAIVFLVVALFTLRFTYAVFAAVPLVLLVAAWNTRFRRSAAAAMGVTVVVMGALTLAMAAENRDDYGVFSPNVLGEPVEWYYAWQQVFTIHPENRDDPELGRFFDDGFVHDFNREVSGQGLSPAARSAVFHQEIEAMFEAAGLSLMPTRAKSVLFSLRGGRLHDTGGVVNDIIASDGRDTELMYLNEFAQRERAAAFEQEHNDGRPAAAIIVGSPIPSPVPSTKSIIALLLPASLIAMMVGLWKRETRALSAMGLMVVVAFAIGMGWIWADNLRFVLPTSAFGIAVGSGVTRDLVQLRRRRPAKSARGGPGR